MSNKGKTIKYLVVVGIIALLAVIGLYLKQAAGSPIKDIISSSKVYQGKADGSNGKEVWPLKIKFTNFNEAEGKFEGELEWPTLNAVHKINGNLNGDQLTFEETAFIKKGSATLDCVYTLNYDGSKKQLTGTWYYKPDNNDTGKIWFDIK